ncbi:MAG: hypothetical protein IAE78_02650 [Myxococcus sp.]|nr:hypothetical protein [Myxococcus sp.]
MSHRPLVALSLLAPVSVFATVVIAMSMEEMTERSPLVVRGTVHRVDTQWAEGRSKIWTYSEIVVQETLKGAARTSVLVKQPGGVIGNIGEHVSGAATFTPGEDVVLFLEPAVDEPNCFVPFAMSAAKVSLVSKGGKRVALRDLSGVSLASPGKQGVVRPVDERETLGFEDAFLARIRAAAKGGAR